MEKQYHAGFCSVGCRLVGNNYPRFFWESDSLAADVTIQVIGSGNSWCGEFHPNSTLAPRHLLKMFPGTCGSFNTVLQHELAHAIGFTDHDFTGQEGVSIQCAFSIQNGGEFDGRVWSNICQHEIEYIYAAYG